VSSVIIETKHGVGFICDKRHRNKKIRMYVVKEQPFSIEKDEFPAPSVLLKHFLRGGK